MADLIPPGNYLAKCVDAQLGDGKNSEQIGMGFQIVDGEHAGRMIFGFFSFSDAAADYTIEKMRNAGWTGDDVTDLASLCPSEVECSLKVKHEEYEGETRAKIDYVNKPFNGKVKMASELDDTKRRALAARMKAKAVASRQGQPQRAPATTKRNGSPSHPFAPGGESPPLDDDVGF